MDWTWLQEPTNWCRKATSAPLWLFSRNLTNNNDSILFYICTCDPRYMFADPLSPDDKTGLLVTVWPSPRRLCMALGSLGNHGYQGQRLTIATAVAMWGTQVNSGDPRWPRNLPGLDQFRPMRYHICGWRSINRSYFGVSTRVSRFWLRQCAKRLVSLPPCAIEVASILDIDERGEREWLWRRFQPAKNSWHWLRRSPTRLAHFGNQQHFPQRSFESWNFWVKWNRA